MSVYKFIILCLFLILLVFSISFAQIVSLSLYFFIVSVSMSLSDAISLPLCLCLYDSDCTLSQSLSFSNRLSVSVSMSVFVSIGLSVYLCVSLYLSLSVSVLIYMLTNFGYPYTSTFHWIYRPFFILLPLPLYTISPSLPLALSICLFYSVCHNLLIWLIPSSLFLSRCLYPFLMIFLWLSLLFWNFASIKAWLCEPRQAFATISSSSSEYLCSYNSSSLPVSLA